MTVDLVACAHGTAHPRGQREIHALVRELARQRPGLRISLGFVDVDRPALPDLVDRIVADGADAVVVPLLLSTGYHVDVDVRSACRAGVTAAAALGPDDVLIDVLVDRLGPRAWDRVVLAAAGSSEPTALLDCEMTAALLADRLGVPVDVGYLSGGDQRLGTVIGTAPADRVAVATYLLAPGFFADLARRIALRAGAVRCAAPLGADPRIAALALRRFDDAVPHRRSPARQSLVAARPG
jgi:sirohydrochlorin ferrochelatase